jgi:hypothetical protein
MDSLAGPEAKAQLIACFDSATNRVSRLACDQSARFLAESNRFRATASHPLWLSPRMIDPGCERGVPISRQSRSLSHRTPA